MKNIILKTIDKMGWKLMKKVPESDAWRYEDIFIDQDFKKTFNICKKYSMTGETKMYGLYQAIEYVIKNGIPGDFVESGVWRGGSAMVMAMTLLRLGESHRKIYLYDTFKGMPEPTEKDITPEGDLFRGEWEEKEKDGFNEWCYAEIDEVKANLAKTGYPKENLVFVEGKVEETLPQTIPDKVALLRLDTDWFASTYHELIHLYPIMSEGGVLLVDDYGAWQGCREAVEQYFSEQNEHMLLTRVDRSLRMGTKPYSVSKNGRNGHS